MDPALLVEALSRPSGSSPDLVAPAVAAYFDRKLPSVVGDHDLRVPEQVDAMLRHLSGRTWAGELVAQGQDASCHDRLLAAGFRDATFEDTAAFLPRNEIAAARILHARLGLDPADALLGLARRATIPRVKHAALAAAIAVSAGAAAVDGELVLHEVGWPALRQAALRALGPERASEVVLRSVSRLDHDPRFIDDSLPSVLSAFVPSLTGAALDEIARRVEARQSKYSWEQIGYWLSVSCEWDAALAFAQRFEPRDAGWARAIRELLALGLEQGRPLAPEHDRYADPAGAVRVTHEARRSAGRLLAAMTPERSERVLLEATFEKPSDLLYFVVEGLSPAVQARMAEVHVSLRDDPREKATVEVTYLQPLGPAFGDALRQALATVKPKKGYLNAFKRNLDPPVYDALMQWLATRPEPKAPPKPRAPRKEPSAPKAAPGGRAAKN